MSELRTELSDLALAREQVAGIASSLTQERHSLHGSMRSFLGAGWTGRALDGLRMMTDDSRGWVRNAAKRAVARLES